MEQELISGERLIPPELPEGGYDLVDKESRDNLAEEV